MKKVLTLTLLLLLLTTRPVQAEVITHKAWATAYCITGKTATGTYTTEGRTVASKREWFGCTMYVWEDEGDGKIKAENFIGVFTVEDTGGQTIQDGNVIDVYISDYERAKVFGSKRVIIQVVESEG